MGEVVHAKKAGGSGAPGELVLAARYVDVNGRRLGLRSMHLSAVGQDHRGIVVAASVAVSAFALLVRGGETTITAGARAEAKTAEAFELPEAPANSADQSAKSIEGS